MLVPCLQRLGKDFFDYCTKPVVIMIEGKYYCQGCAERMYGVDAPTKPIEFQVKK